MTARRQRTTCASQFPILSLNPGLSNTIHIQVETATTERVRQIPRIVGCEHDPRAMDGADGAQLRYGDLEPAQNLQQERLELFVAAIDLVHQEHRRLFRAQRAQQRTRQQERLGEERIRLPVERVHRLVECPRVTGDLRHLVAQELGVEHLLVATGWGWVRYSGSRTPADRLYRSPIFPGHAGRGPSLSRSRFMGRLVIRSGGQTGVDRAALDFAISHEIPYLGWCPRGGWAEDLTAPPGLLTQYGRLRETPSQNLEQRSAWNVRDSQATLLILADSDLTNSPGTRFTQVCAELVFLRPCLVLDVTLGDDRGPREWLSTVVNSTDQSPVVLNVAGPRESESPGIYAASLGCLCRFLDVET